MKSTNIHNNHKDIFLYLYSDQLRNKVIRDFNVLDILEQSYPRNAQSLIIIPIKGRVEIPMTPYAQIIQVFLQLAINNGYQQIIID